MDRFSRTTEIDTAEIAAATMEDDAPKKSKVSIIITATICLLIAIIIWLWVMEIDQDIIQKTYSDIPVYTTDSDTTPILTTDIIVNGIRRNIIDIKSEDFKAIQIESGYQIFLIGNKAERFDLTTDITSGEIIVTVNEK